MSVTSFHRHFRRATSMTPIQYQKRVRLIHAARTKLLSEHRSVAQSASKLAMKAPPSSIASIGGNSSVTGR